MRDYTRAPERRRKRKPTPPRCAQQPLPREGARVDTPSFLWKEVPRRGGGWMEGSGMKESEGDRLKYAVCESTLSTAARSPFPNGEGYETGKVVSSTQSLPRVGKVASEASRIGFWRYEREGEIISGRRFTKAPSARKQLIKPIYSYKKRKSNATNDFNVIYRSGYRYMQEKSEAVHFYD